MRIDELVDYVQQESRVVNDFVQKLITLLSQALEKAIDRHYENKNNATKGMPSKDKVKGGEKKEPLKKQDRQLVRSRNGNGEKAQPELKGDRERAVHITAKQEVSYTYVKKAGKDFDVDTIMSVKKMTYVSIYSAEYKNRRKINTAENKNSRNYSHRNERSHAMHRKMA